MVGGLADWFAVTALFRHPLGHADPAHRDHPAQEGPDRRRALAGFVQQNFLTEPRSSVSGWPRRRCRGGSGSGWPIRDTPPRSPTEAASALGGLADVHP